MIRSLVAYIRKARRMGVSDSEIKKHFLASGWDQLAVTQAFFSAEQNPKKAFTQKPKRKPQRRRAHWLLATAASLLLVLCLWGYGQLEVYGWVNTTLLVNRPEKLFQRFQAAAAEQGQTSADLSINFNESGGNSDAAIALSGQAYANFDGPLASSADIFLRRAQSDSHELNFTLVENQFFSQIKGTWVKQEPSYGQKLLALLFNRRGGLLDQLKFRSVKSKKFKGWEKINGKRSACFELSIQQADFKQALRNIIGGDQPELGLPQNSQNLFSDIEIKNLQIWLDRENGELLQFKIKTNAPSLLALSGLLYTADNSADDKRLADIRSISNALELYFHDHEGYPEEANGVPLGLAPKYLEVLPLAPQPSGICSEYFNTYWYTTTGRAKRYLGTLVYPNYSLTFCLGTDIGGFAAGIGTLDTKGIRTSKICPKDRSDCFVSPDQSSKLLETLLTSPLTGELEYTVTYKERGVEKPVKIPSLNQ